MRGPCTCGCKSAVSSELICPSLPRRRPISCTHHEAGFVASETPNNVFCADSGTVTVTVTCGCKSAVSSELICPSLPRRRPISCTHHEAGFVASETPNNVFCADSGTVTCAALPTSSVPRNEIGSTPAIVNDFPFSTSALPITFESPPKCDRQYE